MSINALRSSLGVTLSLLLGGLVCLAQQSSIGSLVDDPPNAPFLKRDGEDTTASVAVFRYNPVARQLIGLDNAFTSARATFLQNLYAEYQANVLPISDMTTPRFQQFVKECQARNRDFPLTAELAAHWASGRNGEAVQAVWSRELRKAMRQFIGPANGLSYAVPGEQVRVLTNDSDPGLLINRDKLKTVAEARQSLCERFAPEDQTIPAFLSGFIVENCSFDPVLTEQSRIKYQSNPKLDTETAPTVALTSPPEETVLHPPSELAEVGSPLNATKDVGPVIPLQDGMVAIVAGPTPERLLNLSGGMLILSLLLVWVSYRFLASKPQPSPPPVVYRVREFEGKELPDLIGVARTALVPQFMQWLKSSTVQELLVQREELLSTQQLAELELAKLERMLVEVHAPLQQRLRGYEQRIVELEAALRARGKEGRELLETMIRLTRQKLETERGASAGAS